jgi:glycosyltransferase involved in cell wall biosynthesis
LISTRFAPFIGGQEQAVMMTARELKQHGYRPHVLTETLGEDLSRHELVESVPVSRIVSSGTRSAMDQLRVAAQCSRFVISRRRDTPFIIVRSYSVHAVVVGLLKRCGILRCPTLVSSDTGGAGDDLLALRAHRLSWLLTFLIKGNDYFNAINAGNLTNLESLAFPHDRVVEIPNGIDVSAWAQCVPPTEVRRFLFVGRLDPEKGPEELIRAFASARSEIPDITLDIVGGGSLDSVLRGMLEDPVLGKGVRLLGSMGPSALADEYRTHDCVVIPSVSEGFCLVAYEALSHKRAVIATDVADLKNVFGGAITIVPDNQPTHLATGIRNVATSREVQTDRDGIVLKYSIAHSVDQVLQLLDGQKTGDL